MLAFDTQKHERKTMGNLDAFQFGIQWNQAIGEPHQNSQKMLRVHFQAIFQGIDGGLEVETDLAVDSRILDFDPEMPRVERNRSAGKKIVQQLEDLVWLNDQAE
jgi:hypothetical protein